MGATMPCNESKIDRILRAVALAPIFLVLAAVFGFGKPLGIVFIALAAVMVMTGAVGFCPLYKLFGIDTCKTSKS